MEHKLDIESSATHQNDMEKLEASPFEILMKFGVSEEDVVADIGCGIGNFTIPLGKLINRNKIYALDNSEKMLDEVDKKATFSELNNIITIKTDRNDLKLGSSSITFALACNVIHEVEDKQAFLDEINRMLKNNGKLAILNHSIQCEEHQIKAKDLISIEVIKELLAMTGFEVQEVFNFDGTSYGILATKI
jgi:ubiquinone/menaquinone biosynthesis C-methylase UbiE